MTAIIVRLIIGLLSIDDLAHRLFWSSPLGWQVAQFEARLCWFEDHEPAWEKWLLIMGVRK